LLGEKIVSKREQNSKRECLFLLLGADYLFRNDVNITSKTVVDDAKDRWLLKNANANEVKITSRSETYLPASASFNSPFSTRKPENTVAVIAM
jgi:hypothetical protein